MLLMCNSKFVAMTAVVVVASMADRVQGQDTSIAQFTGTAAAELRANGDRPRR